MDMRERFPTETGVVKPSGNVMRAIPFRRLFSTSNVISRLYRGCDFSEASQKNEKVKTSSVVKIIFLFSKLTLRYYLEGC